MKCQNQNQITICDNTEQDIKTVNKLLTKVESITELIETLKSVEQADCPVIHTINNGEYIRELSAKAGLVIVGHKHTKEHINVFLKGKIALLTLDGWKIMEAPQYFIGGATRKIAYVIEDMTWLNIHRTDLTNIDDIEKEIYDFTDIPKDNKPKMTRLDDVIDYTLVLQEFGLTDKDVKDILKNEDTMWGDSHRFKFKVSESNIEGLGVIATADIGVGEYIGPIHFEKTYQLIRYLNHAKEPNAELRCHGESVHLYATKPIKGCKGGDNGVEIVIDYRNALEIMMGFS